MSIVVPILYSLIVLVLVAVPLITKPLQSASGLALMLGTGIPYYLIGIVWTDKPASLLARMGLCFSSIAVCLRLALGLEE